MKKLLLLFLTVIIFSSSKAQGLFVRVFDSNGVRLAKGRVLDATKEFLLLAGKKSDTVWLNVGQIGTIKTKRSGGHYMLIATLVSSVTLAIAGAATAQPDALILAYGPGEGALMGAVAGIVPGMIIGGVVAAFRHSKRFEIRGDQQRWDDFREYLTNRYHSNAAGEQ